MSGAVMQRMIGATAGGPRRVAAFAATLALAAGAALPSGVRADEDAASPRAPTYMTSGECAACHAGEYERWRNSHHGWALRVATPETVLGDFEDAAVNIDGVMTRFFRRDGRYFMATEEPGGDVTEYEVRHVVGVTPLQQYLVETAPGRLQVPDASWDTGRRQWYDLYPDQILREDDGFHWTGPFKTWNARCAECHVTDFHKNYDPPTRRYASTQVEMGVGCEACHGPGEAHAAWARSPAEFDAASWARVGDTGLVVDFATGDADTEIRQCAPCHSRREPLGDSTPPAGSRFADHYRLALLREGAYHADGQILDEVYVYGSFLQSSMYARGVRCSDCHEPHTAALRADDNAVCIQCHNDEGNPEYPMLKRAAYDAAAHHYHEKGSPGARCVGCHMPMRYYMVVDGRRDHSFRVPRPDLSVRLGTPNACNDCHAERDAEWAAAQVARWYPQGRGGRPHYAEAIAAARSRVDSRTRARLLALARDAAVPAIVRATALDLLRPVADAEAAAATAPLLGDRDPLVRAAAVTIQRGTPPDARAERLLPLLDDPARSVRIEVARTLLDAPAAAIPPEMQGQFRAVQREYQDSLFAKADFPEGQMAIAGTALALRNFRFAERAFAEAVTLDPQLGDAWVMIARLQMARGDPAAAEATLRRAVASAPEDGLLQLTLGDFLVSSGRGGAAIAPYEAAVRQMPSDAAALAGLGRLLSARGDHRRAISLLERARQAGDGSAEVLHALVASTAALGDRAAARRALTTLEDTYPGSDLARDARRRVEAME